MTLCKPKELTLLHVTLNLRYIGRARERGRKKGERESGGGGRARESVGRGRVRKEEERNLSLIKML